MSYIVVRTLIASLTTTEDLKHPSLEVVRGNIKPLIPPLPLSLYAILFTAS